MNKAQYVAALRELADFVESKEFPDSWKEWSWGGESEYAKPALSFYLKEKTDFGKFCSILGSFEKSVSESYVTTSKKLPYGATIEVRASRGEICERVKVGTKIIPAKKEEIIPAEEEHEEDIYEWKCPESFVALKEESNVNA